MSIVRKQIASEPVEKVSGKDGNSIFRFVASDEKPDRVGDIVTVDGWNTEAWEKNAQILYGHDHRGLPVGKGLGVHKSQRPKQLKIDVAFASEKTYPFGATVGKMVEEGFLKASSVGFIPIKAEPVDPDDDSWFAPQKFLEQELLELSIVTVPANPRALVSNSLAIGELSLAKDFCGLLFSKEHFKLPSDVQSWATANGIDLKNFKLIERAKGFELIRGAVFDSGHHVTTDYSCTFKGGVTAYANDQKALCTMNNGFFTVGDGTAPYVPFTTPDGGYKNFGNFTVDAVDSKSFLEHLQKISDTVALNTKAATDLAGVIARLTKFVGILEDDDASSSSGKSPVDETEKYADSFDEIRKLLEPSCT